MNLTRSIFNIAPKVLPGLNTVQARAFSLSAYTIKGKFEAAYKLK